MQSVGVVFLNSVSPAVFCLQQQNQKEKREISRTGATEEGLKVRGPVLSRAN